MRATETQLRTVLLAQAVEHADAARTLVSQIELDAATRSAVAAARARGVQRVEVADVLLERADAIVQHAKGRDATVAALCQGGAHGGWLARWVVQGLPLMALLLGLAIDRIANAHRVDLLSPPLLTVLAWNLAVYLLLAWQAWRPPGDGAWLPALRHASRPMGQRGVAARIAADFHVRWFMHAGGVIQRRVARVLHLCAAAWGAGIALSLLLRGLVVRYQFGWESTFLDATQVHAIVSVLFWPLTALFGLLPFTLQEIGATQNFVGEGAAGSRWVAMYAGLLLLAVVLPRLALAAWAHWRAGQWSGRINLEDTAFNALRAGLPAEIVIGLHGFQWQALQAVQTAQGDHLRFAGGNEPVDAVMAWSGDVLPAAWQAAPVLPLRWQDFGASWVLEGALFDQLDAALPVHRHALARLRAAWVERSEQRFGQCLQALAQHLRVCASLVLADAPADAAAQYAQQVRTLDATLRELHGQLLDSTAYPIALPPAARRVDGTALAVGTTAGAAAGAAAGAKVGALVDLGTGGLTLGAGTTLGALLGGTTAWVVRSFQKKGEGWQDGLLHAAEAACTHYLVIAHQNRVPPDEAQKLAVRWGAEVTGTVAAHGAELAAALKSAPKDGLKGEHNGDALQPLLRGMLLGMLQRSFAGPPNPRG